MDDAHIERDGHRSSRTGGRMTWLLAALVLSASLSVTAFVARASAHHIIFKRQDHTFQNGHTLRARGYLPEWCLLTLLPCWSSQTKVFKPEASAQAKVIQQLSILHPALDWSKVLWEVAPAPDSQYATNLNSDQDPNDTPTPTATNWRVDIAIDDGPQPSILEVKRWAGLATKSNVDTQLDNYVAWGRGLVPPPGKPPLDFSRNNELNRVFWSTTLIDTNGPLPSIWCVWADPNFADHPGNIYFERPAFTPVTDPETGVPIRSRIPFCADDDASRQSTLDRAFQTAKQLVLDATLAKTLADLPSQIAPSYQRAPGPVATWEIATPRDPARARTLQLSHGDGTSTIVSVPAGSGFQTDSISHQFSGSGPRVYHQRATIAETGASSEEVDTVTNTSKIVNPIRGSVPGPAIWFCRFYFDPNCRQNSVGGYGGGELIWVTGRGLRPNMTYYLIAAAADAGQVGPDNPYVFFTPPSEVSAQAPSVSFATDGNGVLAPQPITMPKVPGAYTVHAVPASTFAVPSSGLPKTPCLDLFIG